MSLSWLIISSPVSAHQLDRCEANRGGAKCQEAFAIEAEYWAFGAAQAAFSDPGGSGQATNDWFSYCQ